MRDSVIIGAVPSRAVPSRAVVVLLLVLALLVTACSVGGTASERGGSSSTAPAPPLVTGPPAPPVPVGFGEGQPMMYLPDSQLGRELDAVKASGATWLRVDVDWSDIEPTRGRLSWANTDRVVNAARSRGLLVLAALVYTPAWAQDASVTESSTHGRPATPELFATFAGQAAAHYSKKITAWEIWNEPNLALFFLPRPDAAYYTRMLQASYKAIHAVQPTAAVIGGALAPANESADGSTVAPTKFIEQMYAAGAKDSMDAVSVHPYSYPALPSDASTAAWNTFYRLRYVRDTMQRYGDGAKLLWLTEFGCPTATVPTGAGLVTLDDQRQSAIIVDGLRYANLLPNIGPIFLYGIRDEKTGSPDLLENFGLLRTDYSPKPAYSAVKRYTGAK